MRVKDAEVDCAQKAQLIRKNLYIGNVVVKILTTTPFSGECLL